MEFGDRIFKPGSFREEESAGSGGEEQGRFLPHLWRTDLRDMEKTFQFEMPVGTEVGYC